MKSPPDEGIAALGGSVSRAPRFASLGLPDADQIVWTSNRVFRHQLLTEKSKELGGLLGHLYGTAINLLPQIEVAGSMTLLAHCVREIYNRFPNFDGFAVPNKRGEQSTALKELAEVWVTIQECPGGLESEPASGIADDPFLQIRRSAHIAVDAVVAAERAGAEAALERHRYYVNGISSTAFGGNSGPSASEANKCLGFFQSHAHVGTKLHSFERAEVEQQFALFERLLDNRLQDFLNASDEMAELLVEANTPRPTTGGGGK